MSNWDQEGNWGPEGSSLNINFDYGFLYWNSTVAHANHHHDPRGPDGPMTVYVDPVADWNIVGGTMFNFIVWCVACDNNGGITSSGNIPPIVPSGK